MDFIKINIDENKANLSIREVLILLHLGKDKIHNLKMEKAFLINDIPSEAEDILHKGDTLLIKINEKIDFAPIPSSLEVIYEDDYFLIVNKPRFMLVHPDGNNKEMTLVNMVANYFKNHRIHRKIRFCNRLDYETEGIVVFCKDFISQAYLDYLIEKREVIKKYYAVCYNRFSKREGSINLGIGRDRHSNKMIINKYSKDALTDYKVIKNGKVSLVDILIHTGRTHQIRVHMAYLNHPLLGDKLYGKEDDYLLGLQAYYFSFNHPFINKQISAKIDLSKTLKKSEQ